MDGPRYRELGPDRLPGGLRDLVECAWRSEAPAGGHRQRVLPDGCMDLIVIGDRIVVAGPDTAAHLSDQEPGAVLTGLRFRTGALPGLLGVPAAAVRDVRTDLHDLLPRRGVAARPAALVAPRRCARTLCAGCAGCAGGTASFGDALAALGDLVAALRSDAGRGPLAPLPGPALGMLRRGATAAAVADELGCTTRTLHRRCVETAGYGPATLRRVLRFRTASTLLHTGVAPADAAARSGYADQPHLSREVRALTGLSPSQLAVPAS